jgi:protein-S-isoprenylcysteine O-methyltransferase Ste14
MAASSYPLVSVRQLLTFVVVVTLLWLADPQPVFYQVGFVLGILGVAIRVWGCGHLRKNQDVVTSGPYAHVKNPLYVGTFLLAVGGVLAAGSARLPAVLLWTVVGPLFLLVWFGYYMPKKQRVEGERLRKHFGEAYERYDRAVPAFVPSLRRYQEASRAAWSWATFRDNHELGLDVVLVLLFVLMPFSGRWLTGA